MPGLTISRTSVPFLNKIKDVFSRTKVEKDLNVVDVPASSILALNAHCSESQQHESPHPLPDSSTNDSLSHQSDSFTVAPGSPTALGTPTRPSLTINDLPPEILATIFHTYMFWEDESDLIDPELEGMISVFKPDPRSAPLLFCNVCSYWREVAISTPALWSAIVIHYLCCPETISVWLERSQAHPLSLLVALGQDLANTDKFARLLEMLYANMPRWKRVSFHLPTAKDMRRLLFDLIPEPGRSPATQLQYLHLSSSYRETDHHDPPSLTRLSTFPHATLQSCSWSDYIVPNFMPTHLWLNLRRMSFSKMSPGALLSFLKACGNVKFVNVKLLEKNVHESLPTTSVVAPNLQALNIGQVVGELTDTIAFLTTPKLERLSFQVGHKSGNGLTTSLQDFLVRSSCNLECLCIVCEDPAFGEAETRTMFQSPTFASIPHLSLRLIKQACHPSFPHAIIAETAGQQKTLAYAYYEPKNFSYHLGWGSLDIARTYSNHYPFLVKGPKPAPRWWVSLTEGPLTSA
ncbi:hypothetical protein CVT24_009514 [Panaeolus cyanescens]|uniref:Uncharacterized protein n=1 Tax=Panaeolus cyanescens TaxID=181874 RepID=A0A409VYF0_9AGAR|nr:hypothetical protein CVT24_009514 [Panaeolus cyanescens]